MAWLPFGSPFAGSFQGGKGINLGFPDNRTGHFLTNTVERTTVRAAGAVLSLSTSLVAKLTGGLLRWQSDKPNTLSPNSFHAGSARVSRRTPMPS